MSRAAMEVQKMADELAKKKSAKKSAEPKAAKPKAEKAPKVAKAPKEKKPKAERPKKEPKPKPERQVMTGLKKHPKTKRLTVRPGAASSVVMKGLKALDPSTLPSDEQFYRERLLARIEIRQ